MQLQQALSASFPLRAWVRLFAEFMQTEDAKSCTQRVGLVDSPTLVVGSFLLKEERWEIDIYRPHHALE